VTHTIPKLETERLIVRELRDDDLEACHALYIEIGFADADKTDEENKRERGAWLDWTIRNYEQLNLLYQPPYGDRGIEDKASGRLVGAVGLVPVLAPFAQLERFGGAAAAPFSAEVGLFWAVRPALQGRGYASEAARVLVDHCFTQLNVGRLVAATEHDNIPSIGVMKKLGMRVEKNTHAEPPWFQTVGVLERGADRL
jgi:RimJ/RimL family protein N-acetyltransferase